MKPSLKKQNLIKESLKHIHDLYPGEPEELKTRKGFWKIYTRKQFSFPLFDKEKKTEMKDGFIAVYYRDISSPETGVLGTVSDSRKIQNLVRKISEKILEQRFLASMPAKSLTSENGLAFGIRVGFIFAIIIGVFVLFDCFLIPNHPDAIMKGLSISFSDGNWDGGNLYAYTSITRRIINAVLPAGLRFLAGSLYTVVILFVLPILVFGIVYEFAGKKADKKRMRAIPADCGESVFGTQVFEALSEEYDKIQKEEKKRKFYDKLKDMGLNAGPSEVENLFNDFFEGGVSENST